jgi:hypothetical protein
LLAGLVNESSITIESRAKSAISLVSRGSVTTIKALSMSSLLLLALI